MKNLPQQNADVLREVLDVGEGGGGLSMAWGQGLARTTGCNKAGKGKKGLE
jgi:hypothetical protein